MVHIKPTMPINTPNLSAELYQDLITQYLAELMLAAQDAPTQEALQHATQAYCDSLRPWVEPKDCPTPPRVVFSLFEDYAFDDEADQIVVRLSPEGYAFFRAWLRRQSELVRAGAYQHKGWLN
jgi:hypothetical protein